MIGLRVIPVSILTLCSLFSTSPASADDTSRYSQWLDMVSQTQEEQPHWMTPLVTVTPRLEQEFRFDMSRQYINNGATLNNLGGGKGLEFIPGESTEVIVGVPAYEQKEFKADKTSGWSDESLLLKYRMLSANEENGNYIVSAFLGVSVPTGDEVFSNHHSIFTPTLAAGKGWGDREHGFDIQSTVSAGIPSGGEGALGIPIAWNTALQAHVGEVFWPELEVNFVHWQDAVHAGKNQLTLTYGVVLGRFSIKNRIKAIVGAGYEAVQSTFETFDHAWLGTLRFTF